MIAAALHVDPAEEIDAGVDVAEHPQEFRITGNFGHALMKAFIQLQAMLDRRALLRLDAVIHIAVHASSPFIGRPPAAAWHNGHLELGCPSCRARVCHHGLVTVWLDYLNKNMNI